jgi:hypothetical protein
VCLVLVLSVAGTAIVLVAGNDRISASKMGVEDRGLSCAEAGLQYARRFFGTRYETSHGWNDYLSSSTPGYRYDARAQDARPDLSSVPADAKGDFDGDGVADFWVSMRDDDDERPLGAADNPARDNNETIIIRSECINPSYAVVRGGTPVNVVLESTLVHIQGGSGYATSGPTNSPDIVGGR